MFGFRTVRLNISHNINHYIYNDDKIKLNIYHPAMIINNKSNTIKYININDQNINMIDKMIFNDPIKKYLKLKILTDNNDIIKLSDDITCYQFRKKILKSTIIYDFSINKPFHMLININEDNDGGNAMIKIFNQLQPLPKFNYIICSDWIK